MIELVKPALERLPQYKAALEKGWSPDNLRLAAAAAEEIELIEQDPKQFIARLNDFGMGRRTVILPDGSQVPMLPGFRRWVWDDDFCGSLGFRWQPGTSELPPYVLGHIGYAIVPWKRGRGYATQGLRLLLKEIQGLDLNYVELTSDPDNLPSQRVILANGGVLVERFRKSEAYGGEESLRFRINLAAVDK